MDKYNNADIRRSMSAGTLVYLVRIFLLLLLGILVLIVMVAICSCFPNKSQLYRISVKANFQQRLPFTKVSRRAYQRRLDALHCARQCGDVDIPYPFGLSPECALNSFFSLECKDNVDGLNKSVGLYQLGTWPFLTNIGTGLASGSYLDSDHNLLPSNYSTNSFQVLNISAGRIVIETTKIKAESCNVSIEEIFLDGIANLSLDPNGPYRISGSNILIAYGCRAGVQYESDSVEQGSCGPTTCQNQHYYKFCDDYDCCTTSMEPTLNISLTGGGDCGFGSLLFPDSYKSHDPRIYGNGTYGTELVWAIPVNTTVYPAICSPGLNNLTQSADYACSQTSVTCNNVSLPDMTTPLTGYYCTCSQGYRGDGYKNGSSCIDIDECSNSQWNECVDLDGACENIPGSYKCSCPSGWRGDGYNHGSRCADIDECSDPTLNKCFDLATCKNFDGYYECACPTGFHGDGKANGTGCTGSKSRNTVKFAAGLSAGFIVLGIIGGLLFYATYRKWKRKRLARQEHLSRMEILREMQTQGGAKVCRLFTLEELKKATNNFEEQNVVGIGGFGKIYRGTLDDGAEVAVKTAKRDVGGGRDDTKQFINEVTILSTVNHHNLVKLLGCCLETKVPTLVYEFISNGSLENHIRQTRTLAVQTTNGLALKSLDWDQRLRIAIGSAAALSYLHSGTSPPIYHRDVKSANILLDKKYVAKVADFGLSKFVPLDTEGTHLSTAVQGTPGYLDPEYFETYQITEKSDVYSFGVVLLELLTAEKPFDHSRAGPDQNLALRCRRLLKFGLFEDAIDTTLDASSNTKILEAIHNVAELAMECLERQRENRPTMRQVEDRLRSLSESPNSLPKTYSSGLDHDEQAMMVPLTTGNDTNDSSMTSCMLTNSEDPTHSTRFNSLNSYSI